MRVTRRTFLGLSALSVPVLAGGLAGCSEPPTPLNSVLNAAPSDSNVPLTIGYSESPGWMVWEIVAQKGFFKTHGVNVQLKFFPAYTDSLNAMASGRLDGNCQTWGDTLGLLGRNLNLKTVLVNDISAGNDAVVGQPGIAKLTQLRGKRVATEFGTADHFLILKALESAGVAPHDVQLIHLPMAACLDAMRSKKVDAVVVRQPTLSKILQSVAGTTPIYSSRDAPGILFNTLVVDGDVIQTRRGDVQNLVKAWYAALYWWQNNLSEGMAILAKRAQMAPAQYPAIFKETHLTTREEAFQALTGYNGSASLPNSAQEIERVLGNANQIIKVQDFASSLDASFTNGRDSRYGSIAT